MNQSGNLVGRVLRYIDDRSGVSTIEYALIVVAVIAIVGAAAATLSGAFDTLFTDLTDQISTAQDDLEDLGSST